MEKVVSVLLDDNNDICASASIDGVIKMWNLKDGTNIWSSEKVI